MKHLNNPASFRDPNGFLFFYDEILYRQINSSYKAHYETLINSGLYAYLEEQSLIVQHKKVYDIASPNPESSYCIIQPEIVDFISYPYEWCFLQLRGAALTTLRIMRMSLEHGMILKDASAYNMQFHLGKWQLIDTLSFEIYKEGEPWIAYKQFCQHFLAPLALMAYGDQRVNLMSRLFIDGIPLDITSKLLPLKSKFRLGLLTHIHMHAKSQKRYADNKIRYKKVSSQFNKRALIGLVESLKNTVKSLSVRGKRSEWGNYYEITNYSDRSFKEKKRIVRKFIKEIQPACVWDLGANTGEFSRLASDQGIFTVAFDIDPDAVNQNYIQVRKQRETNHLPLVMDLTNPSPSLGWAHQERQSLVDRGPVPMVLALALIHHLAISNNLPLIKIAEFFVSIGKFLVIEFVPKSDTQVQVLLQSRKDIFNNYSVKGFECAFKNYFQIKNKHQIIDSERIIYLMESNNY
jgi:hypothetical protein